MRWASVSANRTRTSVEKRKPSTKGLYDSCLLKALLFDFDGTLVDTESVDLRSWREIFTAHGVELPVDRFALRIGTLNGPNGFDELDALLASPCDREAVEVVRRRREAELLELEELRPGVLRLLDDARSRGLALAI